ncbi:hypothetical protein NS365_05435 [Aureimonas ureilytica]|uniref:Uncharacterized protein n=1 Tax=Aureimonas ureilytica TaxID=401562 RepID=A0A175RTN5_9HYPH|nr:hypothetical protein [Aureimonas ureilytica]KTR06877.1 hypothetical protein NS365_05435 [Aureimonas ureilytica]
MTPAERRISQIDRLRATATERCTGPVLDRVLGEIAFVEAVWSRLDHEPSNGKGSTPDERRAACKLGFLRIDLRPCHPTEVRDDTPERQARRLAETQRLHAERLARAPSLPAVRVPVEVAKPRAPAAQMSLFGDV